MKVLFTMIAVFGMVNVIISTIQSYLTQDNVLFAVCMVAISLIFLIMLALIFYLNQENS